MFVAHISQDGRRQATEEHCKKSAAYASRALDGIIPKTAYLAALIHDMGKFKEEFNHYIEKAFGDSDSVRRGSVNHTFAAVRYIIENWHKGERLDFPEITAEIISCACGAHHGLFDCVGNRHENGFLHRVEEKDIGYEEAVDNYLISVVGKDELERLFTEAVVEMKPVLQAICDIPPVEMPTSTADKEICFYTGLLTRLLLSAVIEGDRRDTAEFMNNIKYPAMLSPEKRHVIWEESLKHMERKLGEFENSTPIQMARKTISDQCAEFAEKEGGIYKLNVPTGGGKTLSSLRYALMHAKKWNKSRIIFTEPLLSILDQNAKIIRDYVGNDDLILEHHSNVLRPQTNDEVLDMTELLTEDWSAPIIITTLVQLLNTLFDGKTSSIRRFHSLCDSIIVIDEVQTVPVKMISMFDMAVNFLAKICHATVVLCSATQPVFEKARHPIVGSLKDIVPYQKEIWDAFERTKLIDSGSRCFEEIPALIEDILESTNSLLVVCNKKTQAEQLFRMTQKEGRKSFHLSAAMCTAHRRQVLAEIEVSLATGEKLLCITTQVIEAGVDISFGSVLRFAAGIDNIIQAAGRCNRNSENGAVSPVRIINCSDENLAKLTEIRNSKDATLNLMDNFRMNSEVYDNSLASDAAVRFYYGRLFFGSEEKQDFPIEKLGTSLVDLLGENEKYAAEGCDQGSSFFLHQAFRSAGEYFSVFDDNTADVIVPYGNGRKIREELILIDRMHDYMKLEQMLQEAKLYTVSLYQYQLDRLKKEEGIIELFSGRALVLCDGYYDNDTGFNLGSANDLWEV